ncbi:MAG: hypothetical protein HQK51_15320 [Oligoflexia bacterium]|nr:hypothetical protein [Oligoflexia bacterium]
MKLAERGTYFSDIKFCLREIRKLSTDNHQTTLITTDYIGTKEELASTMFSRWSQENFFKYMREHFRIDRLISYQLEELADTSNIINPEYRKIESEIRKKVAQLQRLKVKFSDMLFKEEIEDTSTKKFIEKKSIIKNSIDEMSNEINSLKELKGKTSKKISFKDLPIEDKFKQFKSSDKQLIDCIKMIAYRAETVMSLLTLCLEQYLLGKNRFTFSVVPLSLSLALELHQQSFLKKVKHHDYQFFYFK